MSVSNGPPSAGMPPPQHMQSQQANVPPPAGASGGSQSQQNLNQIVGPFCSSCLLFALSSIYYPPTATGGPLEPNSMKPSHAEADVSNMSTLNPPLNAHSKGSYAPCKHIESTRKYLELPCAFTKFENGHPQLPCTYCQNLYLECNFGDPRPAPQYRPNIALRGINIGRPVVRTSRATSPAAEYITLPESTCSSARTILILA